MTAAAPTPARRTRAVFAITAGIVLALLIAFLIFSNLYTDALWYNQLGFGEVLTTQWLTTGVLFVVGFLGVGGPVWLSIWIAYRARPVYARLTAQLDRYQQVVEPLRRVAMFGIPIVIGLFGGVSAAARWQAVLLFLHGGTTKTVDPQFHLPTSFYLFDLPVLHGIVGFASAALVIAEIAALATTYLYGAVRITGREVRVARAARVQLAITFAVFLVVQAISLYLDQFITLYQPNSSGLFIGAGYADVNGVIPSRIILAVIALIVAGLFVVTAFLGRWRLPVVGTVLLVIASIIIGGIYPWVIQQFTVHPNEASLESAYISRNITGTRSAFDLSKITQETYNPTTSTAKGQLKSDAETTAQIRVIDPDVVGETFAQDQQLKQYYQLPSNLDVDRYTVDGKSQDVVVGARELNLSGFGSSAYNNAFVYTHGYGLVAAAGNQRSSDGNPVYVESKIPQTGSLGLDQPRIYFGTGNGLPPYSVVGAPKGSKPIELDYPTGGDSSAKTTYDATGPGEGGPNVGNLFNRLVYAMKFQSDQILLSSSVNADSQILYDRSPTERVKKAAPYLTIDSDPFPTVVNGRLVWMVDGYTTSSSYPYSNQFSYSTAVDDTTSPSDQYPTDQIDYIRNSVKATVDAYTGKVTLYAWDASDPVLKAWQSVYPNTLKPVSDMSAQLLSHVRYPEDLFKIQRYVLQRYHQTSVSAWYQNSDNWKPAPDPTKTDSSTVQSPYYLTMQVPGQSAPTYSLYSTYIPASTGTTGRNILTGYLAVDSDAGSTAGKKASDYGRLRLLVLPKDTGAVPGPGQVENNYSTEFANEITLLKGGGDTKITPGNLLTVPVGGGLLYVQPIYQSASTSETSYPLLSKVYVQFGDSAKLEDTLDDALNSLFGGNSGAAAGDSSANGSSGSSSGSTSGSGSTGSSAGSGTSGSGSSASSGTNAALQQALADAQQALAAREKAYKANDLVAAAEADQQLQDAIAAAIKAEKQ